MFTNKCKVKENTKDKTLEVWVTFKLLKFVSGEMHHIMQVLHHKKVMLESIRAM